MEGRNRITLETCDGESRTVSVLEYDDYTTQESLIALYMSTQREGDVIECITDIVKCCDINGMTPEASSTIVGIAEVLGVRNELPRQFRKDSP